MTTEERHRSRSNTLGRVACIEGTIVRWPVRATCVPDHPFTKEQRRWVAELLPRLCQALRGEPENQYTGAQEKQAKSLKLLLAQPRLDSQLGGLTGVLPYFSLVSRPLGTTL